MRRFQLQMIDGKELINYEWKKVKSKPVAVIQLVHSFDEHMELFDSFAKIMNDNNIIVIGTDSRGLGVNIKNNEELGFFGKAQGWNTMVEDLKNVNAWIKRYYNDLPIFMVGQNYGVNLVRAFAIKYSEFINGLILIGGRDYNFAKASLSLGILKIFSFFAKPKGKSSLLNSIWKKRLKNSEKKLTAEWVTSDLEFINKYEKDPYCGIDLTTSAYKEIAYGNKFISKNQNNQFISKDIPILIMNGTADQFSKFNKDSQKLFYRFIKLGLDADYKVYKDLKSKLLNEQNKEVINDILNFITKHKNNY